MNWWNQSFWISTELSTLWNSQMMKTLCSMPSTNWHPPTSGNSCPVYSPCLMINFLWDAIRTSSTEFLKKTSFALSKKHSASILDTWKPLMAFKIRYFMTMDTASIWLLKHSNSYMLFLSRSLYNIAQGKDNHLQKKYILTIQVVIISDISISNISISNRISI